MGLDTIALLKLPHASLATRFAVDDDASGEIRASLAGKTGAPEGDAALELTTVFRGARGGRFRLKSLGDATLVRTVVSFRDEPDEIAAALRKLLGGALDDHADPRGVFVLPDVAEPHAKTYDAAVEEVGELGLWVPRVADDFVPKPRAPEPPEGPAAAPVPASMPGAAPRGMPRGMPGMPDMASLAGMPGVQNLMNAFPPEALADIERAMSSGDPNALAQIQSQLMGVLASNPDLVSQLQQSLAGLPLDPSALEGMELPDEEDSPELYEAARRQAEELERTNPELFEQMRKQFGPPPGGGAGGPTGGTPVEGGPADAPTRGPAKPK